MKRAAAGWRKAAACSLFALPLALRPASLAPRLLPVACQSMQLQLLFDFVFDFAFVLYTAGKRAFRGAGQGRESGRELTYKSSNGHSLWFGLLATPLAPALSGRRTCVNICAKCGCSLTDTKHSPSFCTPDVCVCVCVWGWKEAMIRGAWSVHGLGFSSLSMYELLLLLLPLRFSFWEFVQRLHCLRPCPSAPPPFRQSVL